MSSRQYPNIPLLAASTAVWRGNKILLVRRDAGLNSGTWAMPGGLIEVGETMEQAAIREVEEETGLHLDQVVFNRNHEIIHRDGGDRIKFHYVVAMFVSSTKCDTIIAGDDAADACWFTLNELNSLLMADKNELFIRESRTFLNQLAC